MVQFNKLRLSGFKSFVEATELDIGKGLTGIIGPNGCGKSNLVEALRWVMGENSPKRMRSSGMDDVIFSGTEQRPQRNTAEVSLHLDNTDRTAPAEMNDADELHVSRKIEREVGSVYKVNGKSVRMRDVQILFADSSIGAHSPAMVSQGRVADMINAKPTQRRMVLEEAAGISGLHARRHEAELKLRAAETNLLRVEDVLGAMNNQLEGLKKQARQASRYRNLSGHIQTAEGGLLYMKWQQSQTAVAAALEAFEAAESVVREKTLEVTNLTTQQTEAAAGLPQLRQSEAEAAAALQRLKLAYGSLESEERQVHEERTKSEELLQQFTADVEHETLQREEAQQTRERLTQESAELENAAQKQSESEDEARILRDETQGAVEKLETELTALTENVAAQDAERNAAERAIADLDRRLTALQERKAQYESQHAHILETTPAKAEMDALSGEIATAEETVQQASAAFDSAETARAAAETAVSETTETLQSVQKNFAQLTAEAEALRRILKNPQEGFQPVLDLLNVDAGLEKALAVALGDDLQAALDGNAPIYWRDLPPYEAASALPGAARPLSQSVRGPHALGRILSQIGLVDTASEAESLMPQLQPGQCLVTQDGGAWRWDGLVVTPDAENAAAIRLQQKNRLAELDAEIATVEAQLNEARTASDAARQTRGEAVETLNAARQANRQAEETLSGLRRRHTALGDQLTEVTAKLSGLTASIDNAAQEIETLTVQLSDARSAFAALPDTAESRETIAAMKTTLGEQRQTMAERQAIYAEVRREGENRARRLQQIETESANWQARIERIELRLIELQDRITQAKEVLERLAERPGQIALEKQDLMTRISAAEEKRQQSADLLISAETAANDLQRDLRAAEAALSDAREARAMAQASVNTTQHTQSGIEASIQEKFACTPEEMVGRLELNTEGLGEIDALQSKLERLLRERDNMGPVNLRAEVEAQEITDSMSTMETERDDLVAAIDKLREGIAKLNKEARERLLSAFDTVNAHFQKLFSRLFNGGSAYLKLIEADDPLESGLEIYAQPPGKKPAVLSLLSGGEQTLTSIALIFAMFLTNPAPICVLDEVDAPLDESNVDRFCTLLEDLAKDGKTRFMVITHHRMTMARMDRLYGVTMSEKGVSQLVSVDLAQHALQLDQQAA
ncbi:MAG: chromosome segregation protein SMC [Alphaproteobacteria bacterium]|nr:chromosome segregation protein SMC [Alphaproteobacteria bacterium]